MAEGWAKTLKPDSIDVYSAGIETHGLNPFAVRVMAEAGVDITSQTSDLASKYNNIEFDYVVTVCSHAHESCPIFKGEGKVVHFGFDDPPRLAKEVEGEEAKLDCFRKVRDEIKTFVETLPDSLGGL